MNDVPRPCCPCCGDFVSWTKTVCGGDTIMCDDDSVCRFNLQANSREEVTRIFNTIQPIPKRVDQPGA